MIVYISASIINSPINQLIADKLIAAGHEVILPQTFCPTNMPHESYPESLYKMCIEGMNKCDVGLVLLDSYERDSSWECGWFTGQNKPLIGFVNCSLKFLQDWMIKGGLNGVITNNTTAKAIIEQDDFLKNRKVVFVDINQIGHTLNMLFPNSQ